jgi:hypothetical protein
MSEAKVHVSMEQRIIIKFLMEKGFKLSRICSRLKRQYGENTLSNVVSISGAVHLKKEGKY